MNRILPFEPASPSLEPASPSLEPASPSLEPASPSLEPLLELPPFNSPPPPPLFFSSPSLSPSPSPSRPCIHRMRPSSLLERAALFLPSLSAANAALAASPPALQAAANIESLSPQATSYISMDLNLGLLEPLSTCLTTSNIQIPNRNTNQHHPSSSPLIQEQHEAPSLSRN